MNIEVDLHTHSIASGHAYSTIKENILQAKARGLTGIALTEHGPNLAGAPVRSYFSNMRVIPAYVEGIRVLKGVEANILPNGDLDLKDATLRKLDLVLGGLHEETCPPLDRSANTAILMKAMENPYLDIIVHPGNPRYPIDYEKIVKTAAIRGVAIEVNNSSLTVSRKGSKKNCSLIAQLAAQYGTLVSLGSDAHWAEQVGIFNQAEKLLLENNVKEEQVLNTSLKKVENFIAAKKSDS